MGRSPCCDKNGLKKGPWTPEEDLKLIRYIEIHGAGNWRTLPKNAGLQRCGKSCRLRWTNYLRPDIKRGRFSFEEEETIIQLHRVLGNKWSAIAARLPGRTDNEIKNYWNTHIRKRLLKMGIDPVTHSPRLDLLDLSSLLNSSSSSSPHLNLSSLLGLQTLMNPELLKILVATLLSRSNQENPENIMPKFQENQFLNAQMQGQSTPIFQQAVPQQLVPPCTTFMDQTSLPVQGDLSMFLSNLQNGQTFLENLANPSSTGLVSPSNYGYGTSDNIPTTDNSENCSTFCSSLNNGSVSNQNNSQNFGLDSVLSTPLSGSPLNSSTFINCASTSTTEDERESYCSDLLKFEIPASLVDFDNFM